VTAGTGTNFLFGSGDAKQRNKFMNIFALAFWAAKFFFIIFRKYQFLKYIFADFTFIFE